jgi:hypothetical protein
MLCQVPTSNLKHVFNTAQVTIGNQALVAAASRSYLSGREILVPAGLIPQRGESCRQ